MSEAEFNELFDGYCRELLEALYEVRGREGRIDVDPLLDGDPSAIPLETRKRAMEAAISWLIKHGYIEPRRVTPFIRAASITPLGVTLIGKPLPGSSGTGRQGPHKPKLSLV